MRVILSLAKKTFLMTGFHIYGHNETIIGTKITFLFKNLSNSVYLSSVTFASN